MFIVRKTIKTDYNYYLKAFKNNHFQLYGTQNQNNIEEYVKSLVLVPYENVYRFIVEKDNKPIGFFHLHIKKNNIEISMGLFKNFNNIYGVYIVAISLQKAFNFTKDIKQVISDIHKDNFASQKIVISLGAKRKKYIDEQYSYYINRDEFPNKFFTKIINRIKKEGLQYEK